MRLPEFILSNVERILADWEEFARRIWPRTPAAEAIDPARLRDDAEEILRTTVRDMASPQTHKEQSDKSKGVEHGGTASLAVNRISGQHGHDRFGEGFDLPAVMAEYRALRASVLRLWRESEPVPDPLDLEDLTRFNESIDQSLTEAVRSYTTRVNHEREVLLANEQTARLEAETANRAKDVFLATLSHEMRTPLNAILGWITLLHVDGSSKRIKEGLEVIERNTRVQAQLIEDILDISRVVSGKLRLEMHTCDLRDPISAGIDSVRPAAMARDISIDVRLEPDGAQTSCDPARFQQIVWNLLSNAIKFTPKGGHVAVALGREGTSLQLTVSDTGIGISPDQLPHIFDRFHQAEVGSRRRYSGLGLGLSIVKHLVEMHGGTIDAHSDGANQGATFTVRLPVRAVALPEPVPELDPRRSSDDRTPVERRAERPLAPLDGLRVLVVDDEADARHMLKEVLEGVGATVMVTESAEQALLAVSQESAGFDVLVSDVGMPDQDGYDLIRELRHRGHDAADLPAIALTGFARAGDAEAAISAGFQAHIAKPIEVSDLTVSIAHLAGRT